MIVISGQARKQVFFFFSGRTTCGGPKTCVTVVTHRDNRCISVPWTVYATNSQELICNQVNPSIRS